MTLSEYRDTLSWQGAIGLGPQLVTLAEELPVAEDNGLSHQLRKLMVDLPAAVAADLLLGDDHRRHQPLFKLVAALEIIDNVYPALDTAAVRQAVDTLAERLAGPQWDERKGGPAAKPAAPSAPEAPSAPAAPAALGSAANVITLPAPAAPAADTTHPGLKVQVVPGQENHVQSDSVQ